MVTSTGSGNAQRNPSLCLLNRLSLSGQLTNPPQKTVYPSLSNPQFTNYLGPCPMMRGISRLWSRRRASLQRYGSVCNAFCFAQRGLGCRWSPYLGGDGRSRAVTAAKSLRIRRRPPKANRLPFISSKQQCNLAARLQRSKIANQPSAVPHDVRAHVRRLLLPHQLIHDARRVPSRRSDMQVELR